MLDRNFNEVELPEYDENPQVFEINGKRSEKQIARKKMEYSVAKELYKTLKVVNNAAILFLNNLFGKAIWAELDTIN